MKIEKGVLMTAFLMDVGMEKQDGRGVSVVSLRGVRRGF